VCVVIGFAVNAAFYGVVFVLSLFFQQVLGQSAVAAGLLFVPMATATVVANLASARAAARHGPLVPISVGQLVCALGLFGLLFMHAGTSRLLLATMIIPLGLGLGFAVPSLTAALLNDIPADRAGLAAGVLNSSRQVGGALAVAAFGALVAHRASFMSGMHDSLLIAAALLLTTSAAALVLPRTSRSGAGLRRSSRSARPSPRG
jgi:DHA2 family methylenomycin A resistance protein-like MFS transporter